jgi:hypothetical protein
MNLESLEGRQLMSTAPLSVSMGEFADGTNYLNINGSKSTDDIIVSKNYDGGIRVTNRKTFNKTFHGDFSGIFIRGKGGSDRINIDPSVDIYVDARAQGSGKATIKAFGTGRQYIAASSSDCTLIAGYGDCTLVGGNGNDTLISLQGSYATLRGNKGRDNVWYDYYSSVKRDSRDVLHYVPAFINSGMSAFENIAQPLSNTKSGSVSSWVDFGNHPLFGGGYASREDIVQGSAGTCYFMSALAATAQANQQRLKDNIVSLGDGTYAVHFKGNGYDYFVREDADLAVDSGGNLVYSKADSRGGIWAAMYEKAWTYCRSYMQYKTADYAVSEFGWAEEAFEALGGTYLAGSKSHGGGFTSAQALVNWYANQINQGRATEICFGNAIAGKTIASHAYSVDSVAYDGYGNAVGLWLRNPWGIDGAGNDGVNDGHVYVTAAEAFSVCIESASAIV